jgi:AraC family transcriptional regulator
LYVGGRFSSIEVQYIARLLVARVVSKYSTLTSGDLNPDAGLSLPTLQKTFDYIDENLHRRIVIDKLANTAGVGAAQFARLFKRATNVTLHQYIIRRRVDKARDLLMETQMPIAEIAHECGFADQVHLTRFFGRIIGTSPASFRRRAQR